jgi:P27 family predicted phage terminase small subunit
MGRRGPLPKPTQQKEFEGNPGKRSLPKDEPRPATLMRVPAPPTWMPAAAKDAWKVIAGELHRAQMLARLDLQIVEAYCIAYASWRQMLVAVASRGHVQIFRDEHGNEKYAQPTPEATLAIKYASQMNQFAKVLGLGPAYRVGLHIGDPKSQPKDPIADQLGV